ncbi:unnamed protein product [Mytilus coruscus]|uniref:Uncharacterized protein n=1 Tax=Mytilus coruscus TaxID=42192 RepID=A0A6J8E9E1_MYTCO|nr:unnamed protein product [Mytilus coruscus]
MDVSRLKSLRAGNRAVVTKVFNRLEDAIGDTLFDPEEISIFLEAVDKKKKTLVNFDYLTDTKYKGFNAAYVVSDLTMTNQNYYKAIELLKNRYGQTHKIINAYMRSLLDMPVPDERLQSLRAFYDKCEAYIRGLESLGQCQEMFGSLLIPVILGKLPPDFRKNITQDNGSDD